jgi:serine phosphatase RsbU (regulator of sigma subunit)
VRRCGGGGHDPEGITVTESHAVEALTDELRSQIATDTTIDRMLGYVQQELRADTVAVLLLDESRQFLVATAARGIEEEVRQGVRVRAGQGFAGRIAAERSAVLLDEISPANVVNPLLLRKGIVSMLGVPLLSGNQLIGVLHIGSLQPRKFTADDVAALERAGRQVANSVVRHRALINQTAARALQASLVPRLPDIPGLELAARYVPGSQYGVGGDWYDVFSLPSGLVGVTIGDVMGHGLRAATLMGRVRSSLRSYALIYDSPSRVLEHLDRKIHHFEPGLICTVAYGILDPGSGKLLLSSAGHLPPAVAPPDSPAQLLDVLVDPPIGVRPEAERRYSIEQVPEGALLCLYTDGVVQRRTGDIDEDLLRLCRTLSRPGVRSAEVACAEVMDAMLRDREPEDDVTLLVLSRNAAR